MNLPTRKPAPIIATEPLDIGVDLDGVTYDFVGALRDYITLTTGRRPETMGEPTTWAFYESDWGYTLEEFLQFCHNGVADGYIFRVGAPLPGAGDGIRTLLRSGHRVHIVTDRLRMGPEGAAKDATIEWLADWDIGYTSLTFSPDKTIVRTDVFVDDKPENYSALVNAGTDAYLMHAGYNEHVRTPRNRRVTSFPHFVQEILGSEMFAHAE